MRHRSPARSLAPVRALALCVALFGVASLGAKCANNQLPALPVGQETFASPQSRPIALSVDGTRVFVANTTSGTVDVIDLVELERVASVEVHYQPGGIDFWKTEPLGR